MSVYRPGDPLKENRVRITTPERAGVDWLGPVVLVDDQPLSHVSRVAFDYNWNDGGPLRMELTLIGVDIDIDGVIAAVTAREARS
jgi:hypothetical protein